MKNETQPIIISIVTHDSKEIFRVLDHLQQELTDTEQFKIIIHDNHSTKEYQQKLRKYESFVTLIFSPENAGFGYGHNQVLLHSSAKYGIIFNPDILVKKEVLEAVVHLLESDASLAAVSPKVLNEDGTTQHLVRKRVTVWDYFLRFCPIKFDKKRLARYECHDLPDDKNTNIRMGSGCFLTVDIEKFKEVKGFDERFFMYFEDNDLCLRFEQKGYNILYTPFLTVTHMYEKAAHKSLKMFFVFMRSLVQFFNKWGWEWF